MSLIIRYTGTELPDAEALKRVLDRFKVRISDGSGLPKMALVEPILDSVLPHVKSALPEGWEVMGMKKNFSVPDTRKKAKPR